MDAVKFQPGWTNTAEAMEKALKLYVKDARKDKFTAKVLIIIHPTFLIICFILLSLVIEIKVY